MKKLVRTLIGAAIVLAPLALAASPAAADPATPGPCSVASSGTLPTPSFVVSCASPIPDGYALHVFVDDNTGPDSSWAFYVDANESTQTALGDSGYTLGVSGSTYTASGYDPDTGPFCCVSGTAGRTLTQLDGGGSYLINAADSYPVSLTWSGAPDVVLAAASATQSQLASYITAGVAVIAAIIGLGLGVTVLVKYLRKAALAA